MPAFVRAFFPDGAAKLKKPYHSPQTLTSISSLFNHFQIRKAEIAKLPCYTCA
jgi:hypothetical protein